MSSLLDLALIVFLPSMPSIRCVWVCAPFAIYVSFNAVYYTQGQLYGLSLQYSHTCSFENLCFSITCMYIRVRVYVQHINSWPYCM